MFRQILFQHVITFLFLWVLWHLYPALRQAFAARHQSPNKPKRKKRELKPRSAADCALCRSDSQAGEEPEKREVIPWSKVKGSAGRPKKSYSEGQACPKPKCHYYRITDMSIHALVSNGVKVGKWETIRQWKCQACGACFTSRLNTPLYCLKTATVRVSEVMTAFGEGVDASAASRIFKHHPDTVNRWLQRSGVHSEVLHSRSFRDIIAGHLQLDELTVKVKTAGERVWLWTAVEAKSKVILALRPGERKQEDAHRLIHEVKERLAKDCVPVFTSDGLSLYFYALTAHFGRWYRPERARKDHWEVDERLLYGQLRKIRSRFRLKFSYTRMLLGERRQLKEALQKLGLSGRIQTAYVERLNLTLREMIAPLSRRTWSMAHDRPHLGRHIEWGRASYHIVLPHGSLQQVTENGQRRRRTPAMAAGITRRRWQVEQILRMPMVPKAG